MFTKIYMGVWAVYGAVVLALAGGGLLGGKTVVVLGMTVFGLIYFGMMLVLPHSITHPNVAGEGKRRTPMFRSMIGNFVRSWNINDTSVREVHVVSNTRRPTPTRS